MGFWLEFFEWMRFDKILCSTLKRIEMENDIDIENDIDWEWIYIYRIEIMLYGWNIKKNVWNECV